WFTSTGSIDHEIKAGFDRKDLEYFDDSRYPGPALGGPIVDDAGNVLVNTETGFRGQRFDLRESFYLLWDYRQRSLGETEETSIYLQDEMRFGDYLTLNLGLRATSSDSVGEANSTSQELSFDFDDQLAPRIGVTYDVTRNGRSKLYGHWGRFYESIPLDINVRAFGNETFELWFMNYPEDGSLPALGNLGTNFGHTAFGTSTSVAEGISPMYTEEAVLGFEYEVANGISLGIRGIRRDLNDVIEDISVDGGNTYFITNPGGFTSINPVTGDPLDEEVFFPTPRREYEAVELMFERRKANGWQLAGSYVHASSEGNYGGLYRQDTGQLDPTITSVYDLPELLDGADGPLLIDREHQLKIYGSYDLPFGLTAGFYGQYITGFALTKYGAHESYGTGERFVEPRGAAGRSDDLWNVDLHLEYPVNLGGGLSLRLIADIFNVSNEQTPTAIDQDWTFDAPPGIGLNPGECGGPGTGPGTACPQGNPDWGSAVVFQKPRTFRLGAKLSW
ncbi:MAG: TonB-dependent receptor, partial [Thermoanaerobaculia bacterium]|nr:TonB-dependent receptor [Thermoanaerobaculia bacterium]